MIVDKVGDRYIARSTYTERHLPKAAGFRWDPKGKVWWTRDAERAAKLENSDRWTEEARASIEASNAAAPTADVFIPAPAGQTYLPYQKAGIAYALSRAGTLFGDEMGLGKTVEAIGVLNADRELRKVLVVCPTAAAIGWERHLRAWLVEKRTVGRASGDILPLYCDVVIVPYSIVDRHARVLRSVEWDAVIADESHYLKNKKAKRTRAIVGGKELKPLTAKRRLALTGTPIPNRPVEAWEVIHWLDPVNWNNFWNFARTYCGADPGQYGWDLSGASNLEELQRKLRETVMVRRKKEDVLTELPPKRRNLVVVPSNGASAAIARENEAYDRRRSLIENAKAAVDAARLGEDEATYREAVRNLRDVVSGTLGEIAHLRRAVGEAMAPQAIEHIQNALDSGDEKIIVFAHHHTVVEKIRDHFHDCAVVVYGPMDADERQDSVDAFQDDPRVKVIIGSIGAMGVSYTLTAASHVVFAELDWVPGNMKQAGDRAHRIGQREHVLIDYLVFDGSLSARMAGQLLEKEEVIERALDADALIPVTPAD